MGSFVHPDIYSYQEEIDFSQSLTVILPSQRVESFRNKIQRLFQEERFVKVNRERFESLTVREKEILGLVATGLTSLEIADALYISPRTVEQHRKNLNRKLEVHSVPELINYAYAFNLL